MDNLDLNLFGDRHPKVAIGGSTREGERARPVNAEIRYLELARAMKQKEDTLYVVAMKVLCFSFGFGTRRSH